jgi:hypothetical protein
VSTPGGDQPEKNPDFDDFDLSNEDLTPPEDSTLSDLPADSLPPLEDDSTLSDLPADDLLPPVAPPDEPLLPGEMPTEAFQAEADQMPPLEPLTAEAGPAEPGPEEGISAPTEATEGLAAGLAGIGADQAAEAPEEDGKKAKGKRKKEKKEKKEKPSDGEGLLQRLAKANPYVVMLGLALLALALAVIFLIVELNRYGYDIKAHEVNQRSVMAPAAQSAPETITAAA